MFLRQHYDTPCRLASMLQITRGVQDGHDRLVRSFLIDLDSWELMFLSADGRMTVTSTPRLYKNQRIFFFF